ncbi:MAG: hypothetical protein A2090_10040 [Deltaproteobacteria bacterium GWD2_42_10]|nr:MAG: hypothetical protein A2090_10040 [Deltaproteobacteria bacterium GWD2_42_10]
MLSLLKLVPEIFNRGTCRDRLCGRRSCGIHGVKERIYGMDIKSKEVHDMLSIAQSPPVK